MADVKTQRSLPLMVAAIGVVYGDIGTSPLYAIKECFNGHHALELSRGNVLGVLSLIVWSMTIVVSLKYIMLILKADNKGEGGVLALMALATSGMQRNTRGRWLLVGLGMFGAALFFGDGVITPAISVLSAVEGLEIVTPVFKPYVLPITLAVLFLLFYFQDRGTAKVGRLFGPVMLLWFLTLAVLGVMHIGDDLSVLQAISPHHALRFASENGWHTLFVMGAVFLVMTGGEALYADIGHFGRLPIRNAWFGFVMPAILINYFGQGALLLTDASAQSNPFYHLAPDAFILPLVILATCATVIASQAVISGVFSVARQAIALGLIPRMEIRHTSETSIGQIYIPAANWALLISVCGLVLAFGSSSNIASAYGIAVSLTMVLEVILVLVVARRLWRWSPIAIVGLGAFVLFDLLFLAANSLKIPTGGWFPLVLSLALVALMSTWRMGRRLIGERIRSQLLPMDLFLSSVPSIQRVQGTAVFLSRVPEGIPHSLLHNIKHNKVLHERVVLLSIMIDEVARIPDAQRLELEELGEGLHRVVAHFGFVEDVSVPAVLEQCADHGMSFDLMDTTFFLGRETLIAGEQPGMAAWREHLFGWMWKNSAGAMEFMQLPPNRVVELGAQIEI
jgi:KUP system potassium uptake protein